MTEKNASYMDTSKQHIACAVPTCGLYNILLPEAWSCVIAWFKYTVGTSIGWPGEPCLQGSMTALM